MALLARRRLRRAYRNAARRGARIDADSPSDDVHALRKRCKELRYLLEVFKPVCDSAAHRRAAQGAQVAAGHARRLSGRRGAARGRPGIRRGDDGAGGWLRPRRCWRWGRWPRSSMRINSKRARRWRAGCNHSWPMRIAPESRHWCADEGLRDVQHQRWRRQDVDRGEPGASGGARRAQRAAVGSRPAGRGDVHVPGAAQGQGRRPALWWTDRERSTMRSRPPTSMASIWCRRISGTAIWTCNSTT